MHSRRGHKHPSPVTGLQGDFGGRLRCHYHPKDRNGFPAASDTGVLPFVQVKARDAEHAQRVAHQLTGCSISNVERLDEVAA